MSLPPECPIDSQKITRGLKDRFSRHNMPFPTLRWACTAIVAMAGRAGKNLQFTASETRYDGTPDFILATNTTNHIEMIRITPTRGDDIYIRKIARPDHVLDSNIFVPRPDQDTDEIVSKILTYAANMNGDVADAVHQFARTGADQLYMHVKNHLARTGQPELPCPVNISAIQNGILDRIEDNTQFIDTLRWTFTAVAQMVNERFQNTGTVTCTIKERPENAQADGTPVISLKMRIMDEVYEICITATRGGEVFIRKAEQPATINNSACFSRETCTGPGDAVARTLLCVADISPAITEVEGPFSRASEQELNGFVQRYHARAAATLKISAPSMLLS